ncbi:MAG: Na+/H+ antiporter NhaA, partial [Maritimibacter sp.]
MYRVWDFISSYSLLLILGALMALGWANFDPHSYHHFVEYPLWFNSQIGVHIEHWTHAFGAADGSVRGRKAATPLLATAGGMLGPVVVYLGIAALLGSDTYDAVSRGWAIPTATDIAFSYLVGRIVFGAGHPAIRFLLLLAIADDAGGLIILAIFYPSGDLAPQWLLLSFGVAILTFLLFNWLPLKMDGERELRPVSTWVRKYLNLWPYAAAQCVQHFRHIQLQTGTRQRLAFISDIKCLQLVGKLFFQSGTLFGT